MGSWHPILVLIIFGTFLISSQAQENNTELERNGKVFSLFSIVQFKNSGCKSQSSMSSGQSTVRNGTCFTSSECSNKGGSASGNCAAGFGVCCLFLYSSTGSNINQNCSYLRNPGFPSTYSSTSSLSFTISKCSNDVCYLRLDFETFAILGPTSTSELTATSAGSTCPDQFKVTTNTGQPIPIICGSNAGQHIYVDMGTVSTDTVTLSFTFSTTSVTTRTWELKISQITCSSPSRPPNGCLQYFTTPSGRFTTFNFIPTTSSKLDSQQYNACIRQNAGYCCVQYQMCQGVTNPFTLDGVAATMGAIDTLCTKDYITIAGSGYSCSSFAGKLNSRYCGQYFPIYGLAYAAGIIGSVCDCTAPFYVGVRTDLTSSGIATQVNRGVCLDFQQVPCTS